MGVLSKALVSLVFDADAWVDDVASATPSSPTSSSSSSSSTATPTTPTAAAASNPTGATSSSRAPHLYPVFEFPESRQRPPALGGGLEVQRAYQEWRAAGGTGPDASGVGRVSGRVVLDVEAGWAREVLYEETLWAAKDRGEEELAGR
ncbi:hypothetical protein DFJ73DRAFT_782817 [Zopfochytrium polystomum]|nr:hypothetical protein DFJ73DRAFT_782817 [Zopfochytrium polystomum]